MAFHEWHVTSRRTLGGISPGKGLALVLESITRLLGVRNSISPGWSGGDLVSPSEQCLTVRIELTPTGFQAVAQPLRNGGVCHFKVMAKIHFLAEGEVTHTC